MLSENEDKEIEKFSDRKRKAQSKREALALYLKLTPSNFPAELVQGSFDACPHLYAVKSFSAQCFQHNNHAVFFFRI